MTGTRSERGRITTFYSYKGGTGRSMLLANVGWALASAGHRVLMVDWDLEAPGLHRYFAPFLIDPELTATDGLIDLVLDYAAAAVEPMSSERQEDWYREYADILKYTVSIDWQFPGNGSLALVPAGRQGPTYATRTNTFNWQHFYEKLGGYGFMDAVREDMSAKFAEVLIDSRTGISDTSGISTVHMPDQLVACFTLNNQGIEGALAVARSVLAQRGPDFAVYPVPTRLDNSEGDRLIKRWNLAKTAFADVLSTFSDREKEEYWKSIQVPYIPKFSYEEVLAGVANCPDDPKPINLLSCVQSLVGRIFDVNSAPGEMREELRAHLLRLYAGSAQRDEVQRIAERLRAEERAIEAKAEAKYKEQEAKYKEQLEVVEAKIVALQRSLRTPGVMKPHAFVAMPFGVKKDVQGNEIDFNRIYAELIKPALEEMGLEVFRADEEERAGDIRTDMFQELLIADLVVADLTLDNPNVWYELGVRHALRARGVVLISGGRVPTAFDVYTDRKLSYSIKDRGPDPATLEQEKSKLADMVQATMESWHGRKVSPVYNLLPNLQEPDWKSLRIGDVREFWERHEAWERRISLARKAGQIGDVLVLADEAPIAAFRAEAWFTAGEALRKAGRFLFGLEQLERGLAIEPHNLRGLREKGICLQRLASEGKPGHSLDRARAHYREVLDRFPTDPETWALLGRVDKDAWVSAWHLPGNTPQQMRDDAAYEDALLRVAIESYATAYRRHPGHYYSGTNALTLMHLYRYLTQDAQYDKEMTMMAGAVRFAAEMEMDPNQAFWAKATLGDLEVLVGTPDSTKAACKEFLAKNDKDWFALNSSRAQLQLLKDLGFRLDNVDAALAVCDRALQKLKKPEDTWQPRQVLLFSGHMIDSPTRSNPRFPASKEPIAAQKIAETLQKLAAGPEDLALTQGACGGDLLFTEVCRQRGVKVQWFQPFDEPTFIQKSVVCNSEIWRARYHKAKAALTTPPGIRAAPAELGPPPKGVDPYERCNLWLLYTALSYGISKVQFVCLWDGGGGDGPGGTAHMYQEVNRRTGQVTWIDSRSL